MKKMIMVILNWFTLWKSHHRYSSSHWIPTGFLLPPTWKCWCYNCTQRRSW